MGLGRAQTEGELAGDSRSLSCYCAAQTSRTHACRCFLRTAPVVVLVASCSSHVAHGAPARPQCYCVSMNLAACGARTGSRKVSGVACCVWCQQAWSGIMCIRCLSCCESNTCHVWALGSAHTNSELRWSHASRGSRPSWRCSATSASLKAACSSGSARQAHGIERYCLSSRMLAGGHGGAGVLRLHMLL